MSNKRLFQFPRPYVFVPMAIDFFHHGHINILVKAKKYGNVIVGLMTDDGIKSYKGKKPIISFKNRLKILNHINLVSYVLPLPGLKFVNFAILQKNILFTEIWSPSWVRTQDPSILAESTTLLARPCTI